MNDSLFFCIFFLIKSNSIFFDCFILFYKDVSLFLYYALFISQDVEFKQVMKLGDLYHWNGQ